MIAFYKHVQASGSTSEAESACGETYGPRADEMLSSRLETRDRVGPALAPDMRPKLVQTPPVGRAPGPSATRRIHAWRAAASVEADCCPSWLTDACVAPEGGPRGRKLPTQHCNLLTHAVQPISRSSRVPLPHRQVGNGRKRRLCHCDQRMRSRICVKMQPITCHA